MPFGHEYELGNTTGNLMNGGFIVCYEDKYYFTDFSNQEYLCEANIDWSSRKVLHPSASRNFNIYHDSIIFCDIRDGQKIKRINLRSKDVVTLIHDNTFLVNVVQDWIFYRNNTKGQKLYRYSLLDRSNIPITDCRSWYITPAQDTIYFRNYDLLVLASVGINGQDYKVLSSETPVDLICDSEYLYYGNWDQGKRLSKLKFGMDSSHEIVLCEDAAFSINEFGDTLFYSNWNDKKALYSIGKDGTRRTRLVNKPVWCVNIIDGYIYFRLHSEDNTLYRIAINSSKIEKIL